MSVSVRKFGELPTGEEVRIFHMENETGAYAEVTEFGAVLVKLCVPDREGKLTDVVLGYDRLEQYEQNPCFFGATIGRNGNRIAGAKFVIEGQEYVLAENENKNNLHSGPDGFEKKLWETKELDQEKNAVTFSRISPDGENGFPGEFAISVTYEFTEENQLQITYHGTCDRTTVANMTNHSYFNLSGEGSGNVLDQFLCIHAENFTPVDEESIPLGIASPVKETPMDFNESKKIGRDLEADFHQMKLTGGYDHNYVTDQYEKGSRREIAAAYSEKTGIFMRVISDCPGVQLYTGNFIGKEQGKNGHVYGKRDGFCLETQAEPNAVNVAAFHSPILKAGETYASFTSYEFGIK